MNKSSTFFKLFSSELPQIKCYRKEGVHKSLSVNKIMLSEFNMLSHEKRYLRIGSKGR